MKDICPEYNKYDGWELRNYDGVSEREAKKTDPFYTRKCRGCNKFTRKFKMTYFYYDENGQKPFCEECHKVKSQFVKNKLENPKIYVF